MMCRTLLTCALWGALLLSPDVASAQAQRVQFVNATNHRVSFVIRYLNADYIYVLPAHSTSIADTLQSKVDNLAILAYKAVPKQTYARPAKICGATVFNPSHATQPLVTMYLYDCTGNPLGNIVISTGEPVPAAEWDAGKLVGTAEGAKAVVPKLTNEQRENIGRALKNEVEVKGQEVKRTEIEDGPQKQN